MSGEQLRLTDAPPAARSVLQAAQQAKEAPERRGAPESQEKERTPCYRDARQRLGERLRKCRDAAGVTQEALAEALGVKRSAISFLERGWVPSPEEFEAECERVAQGHGARGS